jgi:hypothetical protein
MLKRDVVDDTDVGADDSLRRIARSEQNGGIRPRDMFRQRVSGRLSQCRRAEPNERLAFAGGGKPD